MKILHIGDICRIPQMICREIRKYGYVCDSFTPYKSIVGSEPSDYYISTRYELADSLLNRLYFLKIFNKYDILHFHYSSLIPNGTDLWLWKRFGKKIIIHHHGTDVRGKGMTYFYKKYANHVFLSTPDLLKWVPNAEWLPNPFELDKFKIVGTHPNRKTIHIMHAPRDREVKATKYVEEAVQQLWEWGHDVKFTIVENQPYEDAIKLYRDADIMVDQVIHGMYGMVAVEAMAYGIPVCVNLNDFVMKHIDYLPIVNCTKENLAENLEELVLSPHHRKTYGELGRRYVEEVHDSQNVCRRVVEVYEEICDSS